MTKHDVCPWWVGYLLASPVRKLFQDPVQILSPYVRAGMTVLEPGPGMGFFTLEIARLVGASGRVIAVDAQPRMIEGLVRRAGMARLLDRIAARVTPEESMTIDNLEGSVDFVFAFAVVHETPSANNFFAEASRAMKSGATLLLSEPVGHVSEAVFSDELAAAAAHNLKVVDRPSLKRCLSALLQKT